MADMDIYLKPHSDEWFAAMAVFDPAKAAQTRQILELAGRVDVCSICGDNPASDYKILDDDLPANAVRSIRLCDGCKSIRLAMYGEVYELLDQ